MKIEQPFKDVEEFIITCLCNLAAPIQSFINKEMDKRVENLYL